MNRLPLSRPALVCAVLACASLALALACDSPTAPEGTPARVEIISGDLQSATVGTQLQQPLAVKVFDARGRPVRDRVINFVVAAGGGAVFAGSTQTDAAGEARERWTLGTTAGDTQRVEVRTVDPSTGEAKVFAAFRAVGTPDAPAAVEPLVSTALSGLAGQALADSLIVRVKDRFGNPVARTAVLWTAHSGGGTLGPSVDTTDANGVAKAAWTLGPRTDSAQVAEGAAGVGIGTRFTATVGLPPLSTITKVAGDGQESDAGKVVPVQPRVRVSLPDGRGVQGVVISWTAPGMTEVWTRTDAQGEASFAWTLPQATGPAFIRATCFALGSVLFSATALVPVGTAFRVVRVSGDGQYAPPGSRLPQPLVVRVTDRVGNPVPNDTVVIAGTSVLTDADGNASYAPVQSGGIPLLSAWRAGVDTTWFMSSGIAGVRASMPVLVGGTVLDARYEKAVYTTGSSLVLRDMASGVETTVAGLTGRAWVAPSSVVYEEGGTLRRWKNGQTTVLGPSADAQVAGGWAMVVNAGSATVWDLDNGTQWAFPLPAGYTAEHLALDPNGNVYIAESGTLRQFHAGAMQTLINDGTDRQFLEADETGATYVADGEFVRWDGTKEKVFVLPAPLPSYLFSSTGDYRARGNWIAWATYIPEQTAIVLRQTQFVTMLALDGTVSTQELLFPLCCQANLLTLGPDGAAVVVATGVSSASLRQPGSVRPSLGLPVLRTKDLDTLHRQFIFERSGKLLYLRLGTVIQVDY